MFNKWWYITGRQIKQKGKKMTVNDLLGNSFFRGNQTCLSKALKINRSTLRQCLGDAEGKHHFIMTNFDNDVDSQYELFTNQSNKIKREIKK